LIKSKPPQGSARYALKAGIFILAADAGVVDANNSAKNFLERNQALRVSDG
jgi:hypothetical protein